MSMSDRKAAKSIAGVARRNSAEGAYSFGILFRHHTYVNDPRYRFSGWATEENGSCSYSDREIGPIGLCRRTEKGVDFAKSVSQTGLFR